MPPDTKGTEALGVRELKQTLASPMKVEQLVSTAQGSFLKVELGGISRPWKGRGEQWADSLW